MSPNDEESGGRRSWVSVTDEYRARSRLKEHPMKLSKLVFGAGAAVVLATASAASANTEVLYFEGLGNDAQIGNFYDGGGGGNLGVDFNPGSLGATEAGSGGFLANEPSPVTVAYYTGPAMIMDVAAGFDTGFSFFYAQGASTAPVRVFSGLDGTGTLLASVILEETSGPFFNWVPVGLPFAGTARSVVLGGTNSTDDILFDNITLGSATPVPGDPPVGVPEPATWSMMLIGLGGLGGALRSRRKLAIA
jgi:hypothetical protein